MYIFFLKTVSCIDCWYDIPRVEETVQTSQNSELWKGFFLRRRSTIQVIQHNKNVREIKIMATRRKCASFTWHIRSSSSSSSENHLFCHVCFVSEHESIVLQKQRVVNATDKPWLFAPYLYHHISHINRSNLSPFIQLSGANLYLKTLTTKKPIWTTPFKK